MRKIGLTMFLFLCFLVILPAAEIGAEFDIVGTWIGETYTPASPEPDKLTMIIEKGSEGYSIILSDSMGMLLDEEAENIEYADGQLSFDFSVYAGDTYMKVNMTLEVVDETLTGQWETVEGDTGSITFTRE